MELEQPLFEPPVVSSPPLVIVSLLTIWCVDVGQCLPSITRGIDGRKWDAAVVDFEPGLVFQVQTTCEARGDGLGKSHNGVVVDDGAAEEVERVREGGDDGCSCEKLNGEFGKHLERSIDCAGCCCWDLKCGIGQPLEEMTMKKTSSCHPAQATFIADRLGLYARPHGTWRPSRKSLATLRLSLLLPHWAVGDVCTTQHACTRPSQLPVIGCGLGATTYGVPIP